MEFCDSDDSDQQSMGIEASTDDHASLFESELEASSKSTLEQPLLRSAVHRMCVAELRRELKIRGLDATGTKKQLVPRLLADVPFKQHRAAHHSRSRRRRPANHGAPPGMFASVVAWLDEPPDSAAQRLSTTSSASGSSRDQSDPLVNPERTYILQVKGLSLLQSGGAGVGIVLFDPSDESLCWEARNYLPGSRGGFEAEYSAMIVALRYAALLGVTKVAVETDNEVVHRQITGSYQVKRESLRNLYWTVMGIKEDLREFAVHLVPRTDNDRVNYLAQKAMITGKCLNMIEAADPMSTLTDDLSVAPSKVGMSSVDRRGPTRNGCQDSSASTIVPGATYLLQFDGGARMRPGTPNMAGAGMVIYDAEGNEVWCGWKHLEPMTNNAAEYYALLLGLWCARSLGIRNLNVEGDSALIIKQLTGVYSVRDPTLRGLWEPTKEAIEEFDNVHLRHVPRLKNKRADFLANWAMDDLSSHGFEEV